MPYIAIFLLLIIIFATESNQNNMIKQILNKRKLENSKMFELAQSFIGKECIIYTFNSQIVGVIKQVNDGGILLENKNTQEAVNFDFIVRIREYPTNKNGKKKSVILD